MSPLSESGMVACMRCLRRRSGEKLDFVGWTCIQVPLCNFEFWKHHGLVIAISGSPRSNTMRGFGCGALHRPWPLTRERCNIGDGSSAAWQARYAGRSPARYIGILSNALPLLLLNAASELGLKLTVRSNSTITSGQLVAPLLNPCWLPGFRGNFLESCDI
jgi:hypothetical protein